MSLYCQLNYFLGGKAQKGRRGKRVPQGLAIYSYVGETGLKLLTSSYCSYVETHKLDFPLGKRLGLLGKACGRQETQLPPLTQ